MDYTKHTTNRIATPQSKKVPGVKKQKRNNAGGISFKITKWAYMSRFLILGTEGGTYYVGEGKLTRDAAKNVEACIAKDGVRAVDMIVDISKGGRAANNDAAIFALALAASSDNLNTRKYALSKVEEVCRIGTHLFTFVAFVKTMRGFGTSLKNGIASWYTSKDADSLAYQMLKYKQRDGWSHRDVLRLCHATPKSKSQDKLFEYAVGKRTKVPKVSDFARGVRRIQNGEEHYAELIREYRLTREVLPTSALNSVSVWQALLENMPMTALVRNLGKMASIGLHKPFSKDVELTVKKLTDPVAITKSRIHPLAIMKALNTYKNGQGVRGSLTWEANHKVADALEEAFYKSFDAVEPTGKRIMLALDVSGSMGFSYDSPRGMDGMTCRDISAILAMVTMRTEEETFMAGFTAGCTKPMRLGNSMWNSSDISLLPISPNDSLDAVIGRINNLPFGRTDCALPMLYCQDQGIDVDAIVIYTDNETWAGNVHPWQALQNYENYVGHEVKLVVVGMTATKFSIAKPNMPNMLDVVGMDTNTPAAISNFIR